MSPFLERYYYFCNTANAKAKQQNVKQSHLNKGDLKAQGKE
jgi:hypothetical protein